LGSFAVRRVLAASGSRSRDDCSPSPRCRRCAAASLLLTVDTLLQRLAPRRYVAARSLVLRVGDTLPLEAFRLRLVEAGYAAVGQVVEPGEFALRGSSLDVFPDGQRRTAAHRPVRRSHRNDPAFRPQTQRSGGALESVKLLPAREVPLDTEAVKAFRRRYRTRFEGDPTRSAIYRGVSDGIAPAGIEFYLPLFFDATETLFDYLPEDTVLVDLASDAGTAATTALDRIRARYEDRCGDIERPLLRPEEWCLDAKRCASAWNATQRLGRPVRRTRRRRRRLQLSERRATRTAARCPARKSLRTATNAARRAPWPHPARRRLAGPS
jgi:transcription-repair coupling factor (superfamily II helicase)